MSGVELIKKERDRQITEEGWTPDHDDMHSDGELAIEASLWALQGTKRASPIDGLCGSLAKRISKPRIRQLVIAGALIAAEIDRIKRNWGPE